MDTLFLYVIAFLIVLALIFFIAEATTLPYKKHERLFTAAERNFYFALKSAVGYRYTIFGKVRVADLVNVTQKTNDKRGFRALAKIAQKHVDFVLCDPNTLEIVCAVELNDASHERKDRIERDRFITQVFDHIGLPIAWFKARAAYDIAAIQQQIEHAVSASKKPAPTRQIKGARDATVV